MDVRDGSKHALVDAKQYVRNTWAADRRRCENVPQADVLEITDEFARTMGEGERIAPEKPLERDNGGGHDGPGKFVQFGLPKRGPESTHSHKSDRADFLRARPE